MFTRRTLACALLCLIAPASNLLAGPWLDEIFVRYEPETTFKRISEYFTGKENTGNRLIVRLPAEERAGLYWIIRLEQNATKLPEGAQLKVSFFREDSSKAESRTYALSNKASVREVFAGVTGADWADTNARPTAWLVQVLDASGNVLDAKQSFLWSYPTGE